VLEHKPPTTLLVPVTGAGYGYSSESETSGVPPQAFELC
jgi:hypothetical protein